MKRLQIVRGPKGQILGTAEVALTGSEVTASVEAAAGQQVEEIELPDDYSISDVKKLQLVRGARGEVLGAVEMSVAGEVQATPELVEGQRLEEIEESGSYLLELGSFFQRHLKRQA